MGKEAKKVKKFENQQAISAEQIKFDRKQLKTRLNVQVINMNREVEFKKKQVASGEISETRTIHIIPDGTATIVDGYVDGLKPPHLLENEIGELNAKIALWEEQLNVVKEIEEKENDREITKV